MNRRWWLALLTVWIVSVAYVGARLTRGWVPHDEGTLAQSAQRVLDGQLPHRDYDEIYTGGLAYMDALAFRVFGDNLVAPRIVLLLVFLVWVPAVFYIASRFLGAWGAGGVTLLAAAWSLPNYSAAMPSWYNLFFATFGAAALLRFAETDRRRWLVWAGIFAGLSCLIKIVGLYFVAAALLFLVFREQGNVGGRERGRAYSVLVTAGLLLFVGLLWGLVRRHAGPSQLASFVAPGALVTGFLVWTEWSVPRDGMGMRVAALTRLVAPFLLGIALPIGVFLVPYILSASVGDLWRGVFVTPTRRFAFATAELPGLKYVTAALLPAAYLTLAPRLGRRVRFWVNGAAMVALGALLFRGNHGHDYRNVWNSMRWLIPVTVAGGVWLLAGGARLSALRRQQVVLLLAVAGLCGLVQFPFSSPIYSLYAAPLGALAAAAVVASLQGGPGLSALTTLAFYILFAVRWIHPGFIYDMGLHYSRSTQNALLAVDRGGLLVTPEDAEVYPRLVETVRAEARGPWVYATSDCPEVAYLTGLKNPTRTLFDFFDDPAGRTGRILDLLDRDSVHVVVVNRKPGFSGPPPVDLETGLVQRFPNRVAIGRFDVRWRK